MYYYNDGDDIREKNGLPYYWLISNTTDILVVTET